MARLESTREKEELRGRVIGCSKLLGRDIPLGLRNMSPKELRGLLAELKNDLPFDPSY